MRKVLVVEDVEVKSINGEEVTLAKGQEWNWKDTPKPGTRYQINDHLAGPMKEPNQRTLELPVGTIFLLSLNKKVRVK